MSQFPTKYSRDPTGRPLPLSHIALLVFACTMWNPPLTSAVACFFLAQLGKVVSTYYKERQVVWSKLWSSGGMPSSHTALVVGLATAVGIHDGFDSSIFAICIVVAAVVSYDASGVRLHSGRQATVLNQIVSELPVDHPVYDSWHEVHDGRLREMLGHTPEEVLAGGLLGLIVSGILQGLVLKSVPASVGDP